MPKIESWYARDAEVHHNNPNCPIGERVARIDFMVGEGGKPLCAECKRLNDEKSGPKEASFKIIG
jgi:hypothetical protein